MKNNYRYIIWDWNGTLFNDVSLCVKIMNDLLKKENVPLITQEKYKQIFDFPVKNYYQKLGFDFKKSSFEKLGLEFINEYNKKRFRCNLNSGVKKLLKFFYAQNLKQFVLSAREHTELVNDLKYFKINHFFEDVTGLSNYYAAGKTELGRDLIKKHNLNPENCLMIGDTLHDVEVANDLGIDIILFSGGHQSKERLLSSETNVFDDFNNLQV